MDSNPSVNAPLENEDVLPFAPVFFFLVLGYTPIVLVGIAWFYKRRHFQPIKARAREPSFHNIIIIFPNLQIRLMFFSTAILSIVSSIVVLIWQIFDVIIDRLFATIPCVIEVFVEQFMAPFVFSIFICRAIWLYATFNHVLEQRLNYQLHSLKSVSSLTESMTTNDVALVQGADVIRGHCCPTPNQDEFGATSVDVELVASKLEMGKRSQDFVPQRLCHQSWHLARAAVPSHQLHLAQRAVGDGHRMRPGGRLRRRVLRLGHLFRKVYTMIFFHKN